MAWPNKKKAPDEYFTPLVHPLTKKECVVPDRGWRNPVATMQELLKNDLVLFGADETTQPRRKYLLSENLYENVSSLIYYGGSDDALLSELGVWFDTPKVVDVSKKLILPICKEEDILLDFFAGSATTAHAVMQLNAEDGGNRKFIMVQLPEPCDEKTEAFKAGHKTIAELSKERIRRAASKIMKENPEHEGDLGFKVFKLDSSNIVAWNPDKTDLEQTLMGHTEHLVPGRSELDVLYELLLKRGVELTAPIEEKEIAGKKVYSIGFGVLFACLDKKIQRDQIEELAHGIIDWHKELDPISDTQVVFRDSAFENDVTKANMTAILEQNGIKHVRSL